jgi:hypothetical protein
MNNQRPNPPVQVGAGVGAGQVETELPTTQVEKQ